MGPRTNSGRRAALGGALVAAAAVGGLCLPGAAQAQVEYRTDAVPPEFANEFANCPLRSDMPPGAHYVYCLKVRAYAGDLKLGKVQASVDGPIEAVVGIATESGGSKVHIVPGRAAPGSPAPVKISGGILGIPALDPLFDLSLGTLSLTASPQIGALGAEAAGGAVPTHLNKITLPLSIKLNNTLFGPNCYIGTPANPIVMNLTTGTTAPPVGVAPMTGNPPVASPEWQWYNYRGVTGQPSGQTGTGALAVDNTFPVPGANGCDPLPRSLHSALDAPVRTINNLLGGKLGLNKLIGNQGALFNPTINSVAGLPSPAGKNHLRLKVDTMWLDATTLDGLANGAWYSATPSPLDFGEVPVGESATKVVTFTNPDEDPLSFMDTPAAPVESDTFRATEFEVVGGTCPGAVLAQNESCTATVRFAPTAEGAADAFVTQRHTESMYFDPFMYLGTDAPWVHARGSGV